jgi:stage II sporulation protein D
MGGRDSIATARSARLWRLSRRLTRGVLAAATIVAASGSCAKRAVRPEEGTAPARPGAPTGRDPGERIIRVALATNATDVRVGGSGDWRVDQGEASTVLVRASRNETWRIQLSEGRIRAIRTDGTPTDWNRPPLVARTSGSGDFVTFDGKRYRGELVFYPGDSGILVVNRLRIDDYLEGVVPLEIGRLSARDSAALQAQAVTARSFAYARLGDSDAGDLWDVRSGVSDQVYGGADAEWPAATAAIEATTGLLLQYAGRPVIAPYHSTCGGRTARAEEVWRTPGEPYLESVSDRVPGSDRYYCDIAPRFRWTRTLDARTLNADVAQYLASYAAVPGGRPGAVRSVKVARRTESGRVAVLAIGTDRGEFLLRGNDMRYVLRPPGGAILESTYFSVASDEASDGSVARLTIRGMGYGHGIGMCQWGAIGRARAGQDFRTILRTYYPGTTVGPLP